MTYRAIPFSEACYILNHIFFYYFLNYIEILAEFIELFYKIFEKNEY